MKVKKKKKGGQPVPKRERRDKGICISVSTADLEYLRSIKRKTKFRGSLSAFFRDCFFELASVKK